MALGVYLSRCNGRVDRVVDVDAALRDVRDKAAVVRVFDDLFEPDSAERMVRDVADAGLDAIVLAGNSYEHYIRSLSGHYLRDMLAEAGVNPNRIIAANLLEQVALAHPDDPVGATAKARAVINVGALRATMAEPTDGITSEPRQSVMILGCTAEGLVAAQRLLKLGFSVIVVDREDGCSRLREAESLRATAGYVFGHPKAEFLDGASIVDGQGWLGDYEVSVDSAAGRMTYRVGGILIAEPERSAWIWELRGHFQIDVDDDGHARSIEPSTHPSETVDPGIMVVPAHYDVATPSMREKVAAADSAAMALVLRLTQPTVTHFHDVSHVDESLCGGCASCVKTCAFGACSLDPVTHLSHVDLRRCRGCGKCVVSCPVGARDIVNSPHDYLVEAIKELARTDVEGDKIIGFLCGGCGYPAADDAARFVADSGKGYPASFLPLRIPCGGRLDALYVLEAFRQGFDGVAVFRCREGHCHNLIGNLDMDRRMNLLRTVLRSRRLDDSRLRIVDVSPFEGEHFVTELQGVFSTIGTLENGKGGPL